MRTLPAPDDALSDLLRALRVRSTIYCLSDLGAPWGLEIVGAHVAKFHVVLEGRCMLELDGEPPRALASGDVLILPSGQHHAIRDTQASPTTRLEDVLASAPMEGIHLAHGGDGVRTRLLCGGFVLEGAEVQPALDLLPTVVHVDGTAGGLGRWVEATLEMMESDRESPGLNAVVGRAADVLLTQALRVFLAASAGRLRHDVLAEPSIARAVQLIHSAPEAEWTLSTLASEVAMSRSAFAARFRELVGQSPMRYLTRSRIARAAGYLATTQMPVQRVARLVGYDTDAALSKAFKRETGSTPGQYRTDALRG